MLREHLGIGTGRCSAALGLTLALAYAQTSVNEANCCGIFLLRRWELGGSTRRAAMRSSPTCGRNTCSRFRRSKRGDHDAYHRRLTSVRPCLRGRAPVDDGEGATSFLHQDRRTSRRPAGRVRAPSRIENHFSRFVNGGFFCRRAAAARCIASIDPRRDRAGTLRRGLSDAQHWIHRTWPESGSAHRRRCRPFRPSNRHYPRASEATDRFR